MRKELVFLLACAAALAACSREVPCTERPTDPLCQDVDAARADAGADAGQDGGGDARLPCGGTCTGMTSHCLVAGSSETCVGCVSATDCSGTRPVCDTAGDHTCVACVTETDCTGGTHCETTSRTCVACLDSTQCGDASAARCDTTTHSCAACATSADCLHLTATPVCDTTGGGVCVGCLTNADCDASHACDPSTRSCVAITPMSVNACGGCLRDSQCHTGQLCVPMTYDDPRTPAVDPVPVGTHCLWRQDATGTGAPNGDCVVNERPYVRASMLTSVDGTSAMVCALALSTCEAQTDFRMTNCMTLDAAGDDRCGVAGVGDGVCRMFSASTNRCTVFCLSDDDCPSGSMCNTSASPRVCLF